jgi:hypothetical protein
LKKAGKSAFAVNPRLKIEPTQTFKLFYTASFDNTALGMTAGMSVRAETILTFNNAGNPGGSGALAFGIDTDGDEGPASGIIVSDAAFRCA